jgi:hypothetical protein
VVNDDQGCVAGGRTAQVRQDFPRARIRPVMNDVAEEEYGGVMDWLRFEEIVPCACVNECWRGQKAQRIKQRTLEGDSTGLIDLGELNIPALK